MSDNCSVCESYVETGVQCEACHRWSHFRCENIKKTDQKYWQDDELCYSYYCMKCTRTPLGEFDFDAGLKRLEKDASGGMNQLKAGVNRELLLIKTISYNDTLHTDFSSHSQDKQANAINAEYHFTRLAALTATGDGNCLYNSFSILLCGDESRHTELRYRCVLKLVEQRDRTIRSRIYKTLEPLCGDYDSECLKSTRLGQWSSMWNIHALSNATKTKVHVVYPAVNGSQNYTFKAMNTTFRPTFVDPDRPTLTVMWTSSLAPSKRSQQDTPVRATRVWQPDHIVPLVNIQHIEREELPKFQLEEVDVLCQNEWPSLSESMTPQNKRIKMPPVRGKNSRKNSPSQQSTDVVAPDIVMLEPITLSSPSTTHPHQIHSSPESPDKASDKFLPDLSTIEEESTVRQVGPMASPGVSQHSDSGEPCDSERMETSVECEETDIFEPGPLRSFMTTEMLLELLRGPHSILNEIPTGRKDGMFFIVDYTDIINRRNRGEKTELWDDCGAWKTPTCPNQLFLKNGSKLVTVYLKQGLYCTEKHVNKKRVFVPMDPQPQPDTVLKIQRTYATLKHSITETTFKRRITWFSNIPEVFQFINSNIAIVEYVGQYPGLKMHGNAKDQDRNKFYIKTKAAVKDKLKDQLKLEPVKQVEKNMNRQTDDDFEKHRDDKQLRNMKYHETKPNRPNANSADQELTLLDMTSDHPFVQNVQVIKGVKNAVVTLYDQNLVQDIKRFCCKDGGAILNIDKTYNLGDFFVTPTVYKDLSVLRRSTMDHPICFGPTFLHTSSTTKAYNAFLHQIGDELTHAEKEKLVIGSDEEGAFMTSINNCLPTATHVLCTRHLRNNSLKYMEDKVGYAPWFNTRDANE